MERVHLAERFRADLHDLEVNAYVDQQSKLRRIALSTAESRDVLRKLIEQREGER